MKKIPYGISDYEELITKNCYYVDKTMYLEKLENNQETLVYLRPRRFGKTLFTSMMYYYYDINSKDKFDTLFKDTYVYDNPTPNKNNYYVLKFDFSGMDDDINNIESIRSEFINKIYNGINNFTSHYNLEYNVDISLTPASIINNFLTYFNSLKLNKKLYIIID